MILDSMGHIQLTSDGNTILREVDVSHPAAKNMIQLSRTQDEEVGDGTTSVIVLAGEILNVSEEFILKNLHPTKIVKSYFKCLEDAVELSEKFTKKVDLEDDVFLKKIIGSCIETKFTKTESTKLSEMALEAVKLIQKDDDVDIKRFVRVEKISGGSFEDSKVIHGVILNKDVLHSSMKRKVQNPKILLLDVSLEYSKGESMTNVEIEDSKDFSKLLAQEDEYVKKVCDEIIKFKPDIVITEKGICDLALHYFARNNIVALRRLKKTDNVRIARAVGANIVHETSMIKESDLGTRCGLFEVRKIGDEYYAFIEDCKDSKACTVLLRGPSKDVISEIERNLQDAMCVVRNLILDPRVVPGGGAFEMSISQALMEKSNSTTGVEKEPYQSCATALEIIPRTIADNCGVKSVKVLTELRSKHFDAKNSTLGINGKTGKIQDMVELGVWDSYSVKIQSIKTAIESACLLLRIDDIVSGISKKKGNGGGQPQGGMGGM